MKRIINDDKLKDILFKFMKDNNGGWLLTNKEYDDLVCKTEVDDDKRCIKNIR